VAKKKRQKTEGSTVGSTGILLTTLYLVAAMDMLWSSFFMVSPLLSESPFPLIGSKGWGKHVENSKPATKHHEPRQEFIRICDVGRKASLHTCGSSLSWPGQK